MTTSPPDAAAPDGGVADRYRHLAAGFTARVEAVPDDGWASQSPCEEWTARDVVRHVVESSGHFFGLVGRPAPEGPSVDDDPRAAWAAARDGMQAALEDPEIATLEFEGRMGRQTFEQAVGRFICADLVVHAWDLARAAGLDERLDPDAVHRVFEGMKGMGEMMRSSGAFGEPVDVPDDADEQTRLLAFVGRRA
jgi:uncharacterized protein (TIGR03086 family)